MNFYLLGSVSVNLLFNVARALLLIALVPLATYILGPEDYGVFGMAVALLGLVSAACEVGSVYILYGHYPVISEVRRGGLQFTLIFLALVLGTIVAVFTWLAWPLLAQFTPLLSEITLLERIILCIGIPFRTLWGVLNPIMIRVRITRLSRSGGFCFPVVRFLQFRFPGAAFSGGRVFVARFPKVGIDLTRINHSGISCPGFFDRALILISSGFQLLG